MILTPYEPSRVLDDDMQDDQQTTRAYTKSYEDGDDDKSTLQNGKSKCQFCTKVYANRYSLNRHVRQIHKKAKGKSTRDEHDDDDDASSLIAVVHKKNQSFQRNPILTIGYVYMIVKATMMKRMI